jgi:hypothetical protein
LSWLRDHFHNFVFPAFMAAEKKSTDIGEPFDVKASAKAPDRLPSELRKLWTLCMEHEVPWEYDVREVNAHGGASKYRERAKVDHNVLNVTLDSAMAAMRSEECDRLFLGGRDVWAFAVMCERRRIPYMYVPELSRYVSSRPEIKPFLEERGFRGEKELFLDTGYAGSIPRNLAAHFPGNKFKFRLMSQTEQFTHHPFQEGGVFDSEKPPHRVYREAKKERWKRFPNQLFPNRKTARDEAMFQEYVAKYQKSGTFSEAMKSAPIGHAPTVFKEWLHRPNVWRYDDAKTRMLCMTDGKDAIGVGLNDVKIAPGFYEWWKSLKKGPIWVPPNHTMGEIVQYLSDRRSIQRAALLTSQLWRGIPSWKAMTVEKPAPVKNKYFDPATNAIVNATGLQNFTIGGPGTITLSSNSSTSTATSNILYTSNMASGTWVPVPDGFATQLKDGKDGPVVEVTKAQMDLFEGLPFKPRLKPMEGPNGQLGFPKEVMEAEPVNEMPVKAQAYETAKVYVFPNILQCNCGPEEACSECPPEKTMTEETFNTLPQAVQFVAV